jgi:hypothetical protein
LTVLKLGHFGKSTEIPGNFPNVVLEKDGEGNLDRFFEKLRNITNNQGGKWHPT